MRVWGDQIKTLIALSEKGVRVKALENRPIPLPGLDFYLSAYYELSFDRPMGSGVGPIPWSSIINWCNLHGIHDIDEIGTLVKYIRALEQADNEITDRKRPKK